MIEGDVVRRSVSGHQVVRKSYFRYDLDHQQVTVDSIFVNGLFFSCNDFDVTAGDVFPRRDINLAGSGMISQYKAG